VTSFIRISFLDLKRQENDTVDNEVAKISKKAISHEEIKIQMQPGGRKQKL